MTATANSSKFSAPWKRKANFVRPSSALHEFCRRGPFGRRLCPAYKIGTSGEYESMKSRETLIRLKKFQVDEKRRRVTQIEGMIADFQRMSVDLEREIQTEQDRAGIDEPPPFCSRAFPQGAHPEAREPGPLRRRTADPA